MDTRSSGMSESLTLNSDDRTNSYIRSMIFRTDYVVPIVWEILLAYLLVLEMTDMTGL